MTQFRKKPLLVDAIPVDDILEADAVDGWVTEAMKPDPETDEGHGATARVTMVPNGIDIITKQGQIVQAGSGEWLLRAAPDDLWPIDGDVFEASYERPDVPINGDLEDLLQTTDGATWAAGFIAKFKGEVIDGHIVDEGLMLTWFANAIETGRRAGEEGKVTGAALRERVDEAMVAFQPSDRITDLGAKAYHDELVSSIASAIEQPEEPYELPEEPYELVAPAETIGSDLELDDLLDRIRSASDRERGELLAIIGAGGTSRVSTIVRVAAEQIEGLAPGSARAAFVLAALGILDQAGD